MDAVVLFRGIVIDKVCERYIGGEDRYLAIGCVNEVVAAIVYTNREKNRRIISMRKARDYERTDYIALLTRIPNRLGKN